MGNKFLFLVILLFVSKINAQVEFESHLVFGDMGYQNGVMFTTADFDGDGDQDILVCFNYDKIAWYENVDGSGAFGTPKIIDITDYDCRVVKPADIDGDGDLDIFAYSDLHNDDYIYWYENLDGKGKFGESKFLSGSFGRDTVEGVDIDKDSDIDFISYSNGVTILENINNEGTFERKHHSSDNQLGIGYSIYPVDLDGDEDLDLVVRTLRAVIWIENLDGHGTFGEENLIVSNLYVDVGQVCVADFDGDSDLDVAYIGDGGYLYSFENIDGKGTFGEEIKHSYFSIHKSSTKLYPTDIDSDGDVDIVICEKYNYNNRISWFANDSNGNFNNPNVNKKIIIYDIEEPNSILVSDIDNDGILDLLSSGEPSLIMWNKNDGEGNFGPNQIINKDAIGVYHISSMDIDDDNDIDLFSNHFEHLAWFENFNGEGVMAIHQIETSEKNPKVIKFGDVDNDGDKDIFCNFRTESDIIWIKNNEQISFIEEKKIASSEDFDVGDINNDNLLDIAVFDVGRPGTVSWYKNINNGQDFELQQSIGSDNADWFKIVLVDIDIDGDLDILVASSDKFIYGSTSENRISWFENTDGQGSFGQEKLITNSLSKLRTIAYGDLDNDGDMDIISAADEYPKLTWYENTDSKGTFEDQKIIAYDDISISSIALNDLDDDGIMDIIIASGGYYGKTSWMKNFGSGYFSQGQHIKNLTGPLLVKAEDINGDGKNDIIYSGRYEKVSWYENLGLKNNLIKGFARIDNNDDGCDVNYTPMSDILISTTNDNEDFATFTSSNGFYQIFPNEGEITTSITDGLPDYYSATPNSQSSSFSGTGNTDTVNFCIQATQDVNDLNIAFIPITEPRPGFDTSYQLVIKNVGTTTLSGSIDLLFDSSKLSFLNASETLSSQMSNSLSFNFIDINPFEIRTIDLEFNILPPPTVNINEILNFTSTVNPIPEDYTENDNVFELNQIVIGSYDPNDITVLEGDQILLEDADKFLHYLIRFQNTGTAKAINIRVENELNANLDWNTLELLGSSHTERTEIKNGNDVSFIFNNINLLDSTTDEPNSHGFIIYRIKPKGSIGIGDIIFNKANIFFDYNPPIITNTVETMVIIENDDDYDSVPNDVDQCPDTPLGESVDENGCSDSQLDDDNDSVKNDVDQCPDTPIGESVDANGCSESQKDDDNDSVMNDIDQCSDTPDEFPVNAYGCFILPADNYSIETIGETCPDIDNGQINIVASATNYNYNISINGGDHSFTSSLTIDNLSPDVYEICITVDGAVFYEQCFNLTIEEAVSVSGKISVDINKTASVEIKRGTAPYTIYINGIEVLETSTTKFNLDVKHGDIVDVKTAIDCEGAFYKSIDLLDEFTVYPNPTEGAFEIEMPISQEKVLISLYSINGKLISSKTYDVNYGKVQLNLETMPAGMYIAKMNRDNDVVVIKIIKQ